VRENDVARVLEETCPHRHGGARFWPPVLVGPAPAGAGRPHETWRSPGQEPARSDRTGLPRRDRRSADAPARGDAAPRLRRSPRDARQVRFARRPSRGFPDPRGSRALPFHDQGGSQGQLSVRPFRRAEGSPRPRSRFIRHHRQAYSGRLYPNRPRHVGRSDGADDSRRRRTARHDGPRRLWLWPVHRRTRLS